MKKNLLFHICHSSWLLTHTIFGNFRINLSVRIPFTCNTFSWRLIFYSASQQLDWPDFYGSHLERHQSFPMLILTWNLSICCRWVGFMDSATLLWLALQKNLIAVSLFAVRSEPHRKNIIFHALQSSCKICSSALMKLDVKLSLD